MYLILNNYILMKQYRIGEDLISDIFTYLTTKSLPYCETSVIISKIQKEIVLIEQPQPEHEKCDNIK